MVICSVTHHGHGQIGHYRDEQQQRKVFGGWQPLLEGVQPPQSVSADVNGCIGGKSSECHITGVVLRCNRRPLNWIINVLPCAEQPSHPCSVIFIAKSVSH